MARQRDKSPSLMDADFPMRRHGIQICLENEQSGTGSDVVADEDDDVIFCEEIKKTDNKKRSRSNSSASSTGSENNVVRAVNMDKRVNNSRTTNKNSWSSESSVDVETVSPPSRAPDGNNQVGNEEDDVTIIDHGAIPIPRPLEPPRRPPNLTPLPVVDFENDPEQNTNSRKRGIDPPSQSYFLDKRRRAVEGDTCELPSWLQGEATNFERRSRWDSPSVDSQNIAVQSQGVQVNPSETHANLPSTLPQATDDNHRPNSTSNAAWTPITLFGSQIGGIRGSNHRDNVPQAYYHKESQMTSTLSQATDASHRSNNTNNAAWTAIPPIDPPTAMVHGRNHRDDVLFQTHHHKESQVASTLSQANQEGGTSNDRGNASVGHGQVNGLVHEDRSKERGRHSSGNSRRDRSRSKDRSRSRSRSLERRRRDSRNHSRSPRERRKSRSRSRSKERRDRRPSGSSYENHSMSKERRVSGNSNHSHSSHSSERGWKNHSERRNHRNSNYRGGGVGNGRCGPQSGTARNNYKPRNENYNKYGDQEWLYNNRGGYHRGNKWSHDPRFRNNQREVFARSQEFHITNPNQISPNFIPSNNRNSWGNRQQSNSTTANTNTHQIPETETSSMSSQRQDNTSPTLLRQDPPSNVVPPPDKEDYYPPISHTKQRIAHINAMGSVNRNGANTTPATGINVEQIRQNPAVPVNSTQTQKPVQANSATTRNPPSYSEKSVYEILRLIKTCPTCFGRMFDDRKKATSHLRKDHRQALCYVCFKPISIKGVEYKQHFIEHTNNDPDELAQCPLCHEKHKMEGLYIHLSKQHFIPVESSKPKPKGDIRLKQMGKEHKPKVFSQKPKPSSGTSYQNDRRQEQNQRRQQFDPQHSSNSNSKPYHSSYRCKTDRNRQQVVDSELSEKSDASSPERDRNGNDVEHNLMHAPREDIRSFRIPKKITGTDS